MVKPAGVLALIACLWPAAASAQGRDEVYVAVIEGRLVPLFLEIGAGERLRVVEVIGTGTVSVIRTGTFGSAGDSVTLTFDDVEVRGRLVGDTLVLPVEEPNRFVRAGRTLEAALRWAERHPNWDPSVKGFAASDARTAPATFRVQMRADLRTLLILQEWYLANHRTYTSSLNEIERSPAPNRPGRLTGGVTVRIVSASSRGWAAVATHAAVPQARCGIVVGDAQPPFPAVRREGEPMCEGFPPEVEEPPVSPTALRAYRAAVQSDLRVLVLVQEQYFADHATYAPSLDELELVTSRDVSVRIVSASGRGWAAVATHRRAPGARCGVFVGDAERPFPAVRDEGQPGCEGLPR